MFVALAALLVFPVHVPYQNPDQDVPVVLSLLESVRGGWEPWTLHYPSALTNLLRSGYAVAIAAAHLAGARLDALDITAAWYRDPSTFRIFPRLVAMASGIASLVAVARLTTLVTDRWSGLFAAAVLGTSLMFVREHHHGMWDAPMSAFAIGCLTLSARYVARPSTRTIVVAGAMTGLAVAFKYNAAVLVLCPLVAVVIAPGTPRAKITASALSLGAAAVAVLLTSPAVFLEPDRLAMHFHRYAVAFAIMRAQRAAAPVPYGPADVLQNGLGTPLLALAVLGLLVAFRQRERPLVPLVLFLVTYGAMTWASPIALNRYALPLAPGAAVVAVYGLHRRLSFRWRAVVVAAVVALGLARCLAYLALIANEDTRVTSARWLRTHVRPESRVFFPTDTGGVAYVGPDLPRPFEPPDGLVLSADRLQSLRERIGPPFPRTWRFIGPGTMLAGATGDEDPARWTNGIVVTSDLGADPFRPLDTPVAAIRFLEAHAVVVQDYPIERRPARRIYEQVDLNYVPFRGARSLLRPGPRIRIWYVPPHPGDTSASPFLHPEDVPPPVARGPTPPE